MLLSGPIYFLLGWRDCYRFFPIVGSAQMCGWEEIVWVDEVAYFPGKFISAFLIAWLMDRCRFTKSRFIEKFGTASETSCSTSGLDLRSSDNRWAFPDAASLNKRHVHPFPSHRCQQDDNSLQDFDAFPLSSHLWPTMVTRPKWFGPTFLSLPSRKAPLTGVWSWV